ncbi:MAG: apolipoprotein N-acyltransferase [Candidatus Omnitrophica bacterium]|nr:apolipoprotein N-acyltransferase [Candidatus Omnitrophota bacterium]
MALSSAALLVVSFPNVNQPYCAWVALVPWLVLLQKVPSLAAFGWSWLTGFLFFLGSLWWLVHLTAFGGPAAILGWLALCAYLALYFGVFGWVVQRFTLHVSRFAQLLLVPSAWVALEYLRSHLLSGFGWNLLGYSQTPALSAIQMADLTGVWGVSFVLVLMNAGIAQYLTEQDRRRRVIGVLIGIGAVAAMWQYGTWRLGQTFQGPPARIAVVQGNIPQQEKWDEAFEAAILERYARLTRQAAQQGPQLVVWPETSVPGYLGLDEALTDQVSFLARSVKIPLLVGAPMGVFRGERWALTNSAALLEADGAPLESAAPWLRAILPPIGEFVPGHEFTVFRLGRSRFKVLGSRPDLEPSTSNLELAFSVLVCFEDVFPELARRFVRRGARLLMTITNDAWFGKTAAAYQHAQASTFRAVELRVPMVRAANTGWSGCIDAHGRWVASVKDAAGQELFTEGVALCEVAAGDADPAFGEAGTPYRRWGDWFAWLCVLGCLGWAIFAIMKR